MADAPTRQMQRSVEPRTGAAAGPPPAPQYAGLFIEPDIPPLDDESE
ncbi:hypothetical protein OG978_06890 [Streptomyces sp. NBC_01591]|nr:hypothetical protein [Streptomyces sp. NBC_01591]WSD67131.1 hypothetical protein OG978_06890 [Streptomyces sp. NBC_01591]